MFTREKMALIVIGIFVPVLAVAQFGRIEGKITDKETGEPLPGANVIVRHTTLGAAASEDGSYVISNVRPGKYEVIASMMGYKSVSKEVKDTAGETHTLNFELEESAIEMPGIVVTGTKTEHTLDDVPVTVEVVTKEEIEVKNLKSVQDALKYLTGVKIYKCCSHWGEKGKVEMQGLEQRHTLILVDGQRVLGGHQSAVDLQQISTEMVERIEVVKGPSSALYGSDAVGGVVNIITKSAPKKTSFSASTSFGSRKRQIHEVSGGFKKDKLGGFLNYTYRESEGIDKKTDQYWENMFQGNLQYEFTSQSKLVLKPYYSEHRMKYEDRTQERFGLNSIWKWYPNELSELSLRGSLFNYKHWAADKTSDWDDGNYEVELNYSRLIFDRHTLTGGYQLLNENRDDRGKEFKADQTLNSFFIQDEMDFSPFVFVLGARVDNHDRWGTEVNPKASLVYKVTDDFKLRGSVGRAFRGPSLVKLYGDNWRMGPFLVHANPDLKPEESVSYQLGGEYEFYGKVLSKLSYFRNEVENLIEGVYKKAGPPPWDLYWKNVDKVRTQGIELSLVTQIMKNLTGKLGYTFLETKDKTTGKELTYKPKHKLSSELGYKVPKIGIDIKVEYERIGERYADEENTEKLWEYSLLNLALTQDIGKYGEVFVRVDNIFGEKDISDEYEIDGTEFLGGIKVKF